MMPHKVVVIPFLHIRKVDIIDQEVTELQNNGADPWNQVCNISDSVIGSMGEVGQF